MEQSVRLRALVRGRVQMVGFRQFVRVHAGRLGLHGTVENLPDGRVECIVEGPRPHLDSLLALIHRGPGAARVDGVDATILPATGGLPLLRTRT